MLTNVHPLDPYSKNWDSLMVMGQETAIAKADIIVINSASELITTNRTMNTENLYWTKNVRPVENWAYSEFAPSQLFKLAWKTSEENANLPKRGDLILLRQHGYVTHLVKVLNRQAEHEDHPGPFDIYRIVEVIWSLDCKNPSPEAKADKVFDFPAVLKFQDGNVMQLENLPSFKEAWDNRGGLPAFQSHIQSMLTSLQSEPVES